MKSGNHFVPGPGNYHPQQQHKFTPPSWKIGTSNRGFLEGKNGGPGPGSYDPDKNKPTGSQYGFGLKSNYNIIKNDVPGPGTYAQKNIQDNSNEKNNPFNYNLSIDRSPPKYTMAAKIGSQFQKDSSNSPGPGAYNTNKSTLQGVPSSKIGQAIRNHLYQNNKFPGVGSYQIQFPNTAPRWGFGTSMRDKLLGNFKDNPGPGSYNLNTFLNMQNGKGYSMASRKENSYLKEYSKQPGPGTYNPNQIQGKKGVRIGSAKRENFQAKNQTPGPGQYESNFSFSRNKSPAFGIGSSERRPLSANANIPGPGQYEIPNKFIEGPKYGIYGQKQDPLSHLLKKTTPGPGQYDPEYKMLSYKERAASPLIGTSMRSDFTKQKRGIGPGQYDIRKGIGGPKWGFGSSVRQPLNSNDGQPGPGTYNIPPKFNDVPKYLLPNQSYQ